MIRGWILDLLIEHLRKNGSELGLRIAKEVVLPYLKESKRRKRRMDSTTTRFAKSNASWQTRSS